ncbi:MAG: AMP-binding protein [Nocardioidaceae bacterium]
MVTTRDAESILANRASTVGRMFFDRVESSRDREAYSYPVDDIWKSVTWGEVADHVVKLSAGLIALGVQPEQRVAIDSGTRYEWVLADLAIISAGAATTTVYPSSLPEDVAFIVGDSDSHVVFAENDEQVAKLRERRAELPALSKVVTFDGTTDGDWVINLSDLESLGAALLVEDPDIVKERVDHTGPDSLATLVYTSGTTGRPKGVRLRHSCWTYEGAAVDALGILSVDDVQFLWLPLAHCFGKVLLTAQLAVGFPTAIDGRVDKIVENLAVVRPTFMGRRRAYSRRSTAASTGWLQTKVVSRRRSSIGPLPSDQKCHGASWPGRRSRHTSSPSTSSSTGWYSRRFGTGSGGE